MKKTLIILLCLTTSLGFGQLLPISLLGGQQYALANTKIIVNPGDSVEYRESWCLNSNCQLSNLDTSVVLYGTAIDTIFQNIVEVANGTSQPIVVFHQRLLINLITGDTLGNIIMPVTIYPNFSLPLVSYITAITTIDSIKIVGSVVPNDTSAQLKFWMRYQTCTSGQAFSLPPQTFSGFSLVNFQYTIPASFPCSYQVGIQLKLTNSVGIDSTGFNCANTLACGSPYATTYDSLVSGVSMVDLYGRVATMNQSTTVIDSVGLPGQGYFAGNSIVIPGQSLGETAVYQQIANLNPGTLYAFKRCVLDSNGVLSNCQGPVLTSTQQMPTLLSFVIQNAMTTNATTERIDVLQTSAVAGTFWLELSTNSSFSGVIATSAFPCLSSMNFTGGQITIAFNVCHLSSPLYGNQNFVNGMTYWVRAVGNNQNGEMATSLPFSFVFNFTVGIQEIFDQSIWYVSESEMIFRGDYEGPLQISDMLGREILRTEKSGFEIKIPIYNLKRGAYIISGSGLKGKKFIF